MLGLYSIYTANENQLKKNMAKIILVGLVLLFAFLWATGLLSRKPEEQVKSKNSSNIKEVEVLIIELKAKKLTKKDIELIDKTIEEQKNIPISIRFPHH